VTAFLDAIGYDAYDVGPLSEGWRFQAGAIADAYSTDGSFDPHTFKSTAGDARASYASGGGGASRVPRIAGDVTAGSALVSCVLVVGYAPCAERRRF